MCRREDRQQNAEWLGSLEQPASWARQHICSISHIAAPVSAWRRTCRGECSRPIFFSAPSISRMRCSSPPFITRSVGMQSRRHQFGTKRTKCVLEFQVNSPSSLKSQAWEGRGEAGNEDDLGSLWWWAAGGRGGLKGGTILMAVCFQRSYKICC